MIYFEPPRRLHHVEGPDHIAVEIGARVFQAVSHARLRGQMHDLVGFPLAGKAAQRLHIFQHRFARLEVLVRLEQFVPTPLEIDVVIVSHPIVAEHDKALRKQRLRQMVADKSGAPGDEYGLH